MRKKIIFGGLYAIVITLFAVVVFSTSAAQSLFFKFSDSPTVYKAYNTPEEFIKDGGDWDRIQVFDQQYGKASSEFVNYATNMIGTKTGTTTTGVYFSDGTATSSYVVLLSDYAQSTVVTVNALAASSSQSHVALSFRTSNDDYCDTASTTGGTMDPVITKDIMWEDAAPFIDGHAAQTTLANATTTVAWQDPTAGEGRQVLLTNLIARCLRLDVSASSTILWAQIRQK